MPKHKHTASQSAHTHSKGTMDIKGRLTGVEAINGSGISGNGAFSVSKSNRNGNGGGPDYGYTVNFKASNSWSGVTTSARPSISIGYSGSGTPFNIEPSYITLHLWRRLS
ncbi:hypothetical protein [Fusobacterium sp. IOR10]|uniref:hypothetical protein n=1 Tax=Fusobacterium sp. IOR10 TaxID=2665157 RepID=UPI0013D6ABD3|nr:hypothetical protein [Fusobacterium sp. IOR10]